MWKLLARLFKKQITIDKNAPTIPQAFNYPIDQYDRLVSDMVNLIREDNRFESFEHFIHSQRLVSYHLDVAIPRDALLVGYAFATAVMLQRSEKMRQAADNALEAFAPKRSVH